MLIVAIVLGLVFLAVILLSIPIDLAFSYERGQGSRSRMRIGWLFGLIGKELGGEKKAGRKSPRRGRQKRGGGASEGFWPCSGPKTSPEGSSSLPSVWLVRFRYEMWM